MLSFGDPYLLKHFFSVLSFPFSRSPVHSDPLRDLKFKNHRAFLNTGRQVSRAAPQRERRNDRRPLGAAFPQVKPPAPFGHPEAASTLRALGLRRAEAVTFAPAAPSATSRLGRPRTGGRKNPLTRAILPTAAARRRRRRFRAPRQRCNAGPTAREAGKGARGPRRPHSPRRSLAARARTPPGPGAPSAAAAGEGGRVKFISGAAPASLPRAPPTRRADPLPRRSR